ncbi:PPC domain-containing DNA-binding protein [Amnibacterium flavum]|uniref:PPC domain-containing protein n=1 Tax=Amnibacterium flavum TaxID=2173173 RepID=A0A2V1HMU0_9MICO|nr:PPC domain-containing DNA-binding protein [Amnibacterium flavum]PVZ93741.1 hypothetical protein DDQ50_08055 [Amnibacterium flavum]
MFAAELSIGRRFLVVLQPGDEVLEGVREFCRQHQVGQAYLSSFLGAYTTATLIGTADPIEDEDAPLPKSVTFRNLEGVGSGTIVTVDDLPVPHIHVALGEKGDRAAAYAGHLLAATVQYVTEIVVEEVLSPRLTKRADPAARGLANIAIAD